MSVRNARHSATPSLPGQLPSYGGGLIVGVIGRSAIGTVVERASRCVMLVHLPVERTAEAVRDGLIALWVNSRKHFDDP
ncbi:hypothetical protein BH09ACT8_BH09ACT8_28400 [soil metagenome]